MTYIDTVYMMQIWCQPHPNQVYWRWFAATDMMILAYSSGLVD